jgi:Protein of unknown function (DUF3054)
MNRRQVLIAAVLDVALVIVFVLLGKRNHDETANALGIAAPFVIALAAGWGVVRAWTAPMAMRTGLVLWVVTVALGMVLRHWVFDRGTALSFVIVATLVLGTFLVGWRAIAAAAVRSRHERA